MSGIKLNELFSRQIREVYRLVVLDEDSLQERASFRLSPLNVYIAISTMLIAVILLIFLLVVYTPLKEYIPGYADPQLRKQLRQLTSKLDSAETALNQNKRYLDNVFNVVSGKNLSTKDSLKNVNPKLYDAELLELSKGNDSILKKMLIDMTSADLPTSRNKSGMYTWPMLNSKISRTYNRTGAFSGVDIVSTSDSLVTSIQPGLVLYAGYLPGAGECLLIQSTDGSLLGYSNLGECLKKSGNFVKASEVIGYSKLRKIRFSLWINGSPVDPTPLFQASIQ